MVGKYGTILWTGALAVLVGTGAYLSLIYGNAGSGGADQGTVYSVAMVDGNLAYDPGSWLGRTIQVRGEIVACMAAPSAGGGPCTELTQDAAWPDGYSHFASGSPHPLPVTRAGLDPLRSVLRWVPLWGRLAPAPQELHWGVVATYRVQLAPVPNSICGAGACAEARLLDSAP
ncbi:MAG: hypothetical protein ACRDG4_11135 [Chloroflexota bacterium]